MLHELLSEINQELESYLSTTEMQINWVAEIFAARAKCDLFSAYVFVLRGCTGSSPCISFLGPVWSEHDCPTPEPSREISRSESHCCWNRR